MDPSQRARAMQRARLLAAAPTTGPLNVAQCWSSPERPKQVCADAVMSFPRRWGALLYSRSNVGYIWARDGRGRALPLSRSGFAVSAVLT